ncbi:MAG: dihydrofolate reductase [bacterium]
MEIILYVIRGSNYIIDNDGLLKKIHLEEEMEFFNELTKNNACVIGKNTSKVINQKFMASTDRDLFVLRHKQKAPDPGARVFYKDSIMKLLSCVEQKGHNKVFIIGGENIFNQFLEEKFVLLDKIIIVEINELFHGTKFFLPLDEEKWKKKKMIRECLKGRKNSHSFKIFEYTRS